jgi:elongation factor 1-gamma
VDQWIDFSVNEIELPLNVWVFPVLGWMDFHHDATEKAKQDVSKALNILNQHLLHHTFLVGEGVTLADIAVAMALLRGYKLVFDPKFRRPFEAVNRWFNTCITQPFWKDVLGDVVLSEEMAVAKGAPKKHKKPSSLDSLPPSNLHLDEFKRKLGHSDDIRGDVMKWFWGHLDEGYSIWFATHTKKFETHAEASNAIEAVTHALEHFHKYAAASFVIFGEEPSLELAVCFVLRGQDVPAEMNQLEFAKNFTWKKADVSVASTKELIDDFFSRSGGFGGAKYNDGRLFK